MARPIRASAPRSRQRGFFDFSITELAIIFGVALVVLGPKKLPGLVAQVGRWVGRARHMARQFREQLEQEVNSISDVKPAARSATAPVGPPPPEAPVHFAMNGGQPDVVAENPHATGTAAPADPPDHG